MNNIRVDHEAVLSKLKELKDESKGEADILSIASKQLIPQNIDIPKPDSLFSMNDIDFFTRKSLSMVQADAKSGKTTAVAWMVAQMIVKLIRVLFFDTEQGEYYGSRTQSWILRMTGTPTTEYLQYYDLSIFPPSQRTEMIEALIKEFKPDLIVIDGVRDLVSDINSPDEATTVSTDEMKWARVYDCHILNIIHENKGDSKSARGHLGREIENKCETALRVETNEDNQIIVTPIRYRGQPIEPFALVRDEYGIPSLWEDWTPTTGGKKTIQPTDYEPAVHSDVIKKVFSKKEYLTREECRDNIKEYFGLSGVIFGDTKAREFLTHYTQSGLIIEDQEVKGWAKLRNAPEGI